MAAHHTTIADVIAPFVAARGTVPATPTFVVASADAAYEALARAEVDLAISTTPPREVASLLVAEFPIWAQVPPTHSWAELTGSGPRRSCAERLVLLDRTPGTRRVFDDEVAARRRLPLVAEVGVAEVAQAMSAPA